MKTSEIIEGLAYRRGNCVRRVVKIESTHIIDGWAVEAAIVERVKGRAPHGGCYTRRVGDLFEIPLSRFAQWAKEVER